ncbi:branched-chain amino acid ABC transporter substrate-binding protein [Aestuariivirga sp.]|uniref:branched-chain amino acid ABC transporter substrate-binding protein n=1 Tax=Aestuariivirga sp. TaxID=2650926 RepID=UPI00391DEEFD
MNKFVLTGVAFSFAAVLSATSALADITVATVGPITGQLAALGEQYSQGAKKAVEDINAAGGINGEKLVLEIGDDACDPKQAVNVANQMASKGVKFVAGHLCSGSSIPASKVYEEEGILMISPASTNPKLTDEGGWNVARVCGRDDAQGKVAGAFLSKNYAGKKVAIVDDKSAYGKGLADETRKAMNAAGLTEALNESINPGEKDYSALVSKLKDAGVEAVYFGGYHPEAGLILKQMGEQGLNARMVSGDSMNSAELWTIAGKAAENLIFTFAPDPRNFPSANAIVEQFKTAGYDPEGYTLYTYAAFEMMKQAAEATKSNDPQKIAEWLRAGNTTKTVLGDITLDAKGDLVNPVYVWYTFKDGKYFEDPSIQ